MHDEFSRFSIFCELSIVLNDALHCVRVSILNMSELLKLEIDATEIAREPISRIAALSHLVQRH